MLQQIQSMEATKNKTTNHTISATKKPVSKSNSLFSVTSSLVQNTNKTNNTINNLWLFKKTTLGEYIIVGTLTGIALISALIMGVQCLLFVVSYDRVFIVFICLSFKICVETEDFILVNCIKSVRCPFRNVFFSRF